MKTKKESRVKRISLWDGFSADETGTVMSLMKEYILEEDTVLFKEGDSGREMFIIKEGRVAVSVGLAGGEEMHLAEMGSGSFFGEMSLIENLPRSATCRLLQKSTLLGLDNEGLRFLMENRSVLAKKILHNMLTITASRLQNTGALLHDMVQWGEKARLRVITDGFTGLFNRRFLDESIQSEFRKAAKNHTPLSLAMVDLDRFGSVNRQYGEAFGDTIILKAVETFRNGFRQTDILARYGGDEFTFLFPSTSGTKAQELCAEVCDRVSRIEFAEHPGFRITASMGIAAYPEHAQTVEALSAKADKALYEAKESGRNRAVLAHKGTRSKHPFASIAEANRIFDRIVALLRERDSFLLLGHELPDEDCISSLVAMALLIRKFGKEVTVYIRAQVAEQLSYLMEICSYNTIPVLHGEAYNSPKPDALFILDTPKPDMIASNADINVFLADPELTRVEFDHHLSADAAYSGTEGFCYVNRASSTCELIGLFCCKMTTRDHLLEDSNIHELFSRNIVLAMLTGMIGDSRFGLTLKTKRDLFFYNLLANKFAGILHLTAHKNSSNYASMTEIFKSIQSLSVEEKDLYQMLLDRAKYSGRTGIVALDAEESQNCLAHLEYSIFVKVIKSVTDYLSEKSGTFGLTAYYDMPEISDLVQFRIRTSRDITGIDLRTILLDFSITDGGGHPGAIGFRMPKSEIGNLDDYVRTLLEKVESL